MTRGGPDAVLVDGATMDERLDLGDGAWVRLVCGLVDDNASWMERLVRALPLRQETLTFFGKPQLTPRLTSWHGDEACTYTYSGRTFVPLPWTDALRALERLAASQAGTRFNTVLVNLYRDGDDSMGEHSDDEPELGPAAPDDVLIASLSLGAHRRFVLRHRRTRVVRAFMLGQGDLLLMGGSTQRGWRHHVPRAKTSVGPRMNLTFRIIR